MRLKLIMGAAFLGVLGAFLLWSVQWSLDDRRDVTFEMPGRVTTFKAYESQQKIGTTELTLASRELRRYLTDHGLSLIVASPGDGAPQMTVFDPGQHLSWLKPALAASGKRGGVFLFKDSYSERRWSASSVTPLLPEGTSVAGIVTPPAGVGDLQYVEFLGGLFPPGDYVLSGTNGVNIVQVQQLLRRQGVKIQEPYQIPLLPYLLHSPLVMATALFLTSGYLSLAAYWLMLLATRKPELVIRRRHGAPLSTVVRKWFLAGLPLAAMIGFISVLLALALGDFLSQYAVLRGGEQLRARHAVTFNPYYERGGVSRVDDATIEALISQIDKNEAYSAILYNVQIDNPNFANGNPTIVLFGDVLSDVFSELKLCTPAPCAMRGSALAGRSIAPIEFAGETLNAEEVLKPSATFFDANAAGLPLDHRVILRLPPQDLLRVNPIEREEALSRTVLFAPSAKQVDTFLAASLRGGLYLVPHDVAIDQSRRFQIIMARSAVYLVGFAAFLGLLLSTFAAAAALANRRIG